MNGQAGANCPSAETLGPDHDFGNAPILARANGKDIIVAGQNSPYGNAIYAFDKTNVQPRIGVTFDPQATGRTIYRSSYGIYYDPGSNRVFTCNHGSHDITAIDPVRAEVVGTVKVQGDGEAAVTGEDGLLYVNLEECTSCTACYQPDVCPVGAIYSEEVVPDGAAKTHYNSADENKGHDHSFFAAQEPPSLAFLAARLTR